MSLPVLSGEDVEKILPSCKVLGNPLYGGQKVVFPCLINGVKNALKFMLIESNISDYEDVEDTTSVLVDQVTARAYREVETMAKCDSPYIIKLGNIGIRKTICNNQHLIYFSEQWIEGIDLKEELKANGIVSVEEGLKICLHISTAIMGLWEQKKIHRDIKPGNIVHDSITGNYILLDMGFAFDLEDKSLTAIGRVPGTKIYFSPEQLNPDKKRQMDFRSDLFNLGIVLYEVMTGRHPFYKRGITDFEIYQKILLSTPSLPSSINYEIPKELDDIIMRLLSKKAHMRYRSCSQIIDRVKELEQGVMV